MPSASADVDVSRPGKVLFPGANVAKGEVCDYYRRVGETMLPHLRRRPLTLQRFPDGIGAAGFFQKHASSHFPDQLGVVDVVMRSGGVQRSPMVSTVSDLVYLADQAAIEFHVWPACVDALESPDMLIVDVDPPEPTHLGELRSVVRRARDLLRDLGLNPFVQATGGKGYHVVAALDATTPFDTVRGFAAAVAQTLVAADPKRLTTAHRKGERGGRTYLDMNRNGYGQTFVAPYSLRARAGATVAVPLDWDELSRSTPCGWDLRRAQRRLARKSDPWESLHAHPASAAAAWEQLEARNGN